MARRNRRRMMPEPFEATIEGLSHEGRGICHHNGKIVFVFAALPGERVVVQINKTNKKYSEANIIEVLDASPNRILPKCAVFNMCGGCSMQHVNAAHQLELKQQAVQEMLTHAGIEVDSLLPALRAHEWGYRRKARLGVKYVIKKQRLLIGFRERNKPYLTDMESCPVLIDKVGQHLTDLMQLITQLQSKDKIAQIEVAADDDNCMLVFRHLEPLSDSDQQQIIQFAKDCGLWIQLQPQGPETMHPLFPEKQVLKFKPLKESDISIEFGARDFTQVNADINQQMVKQALHHLDLQTDDNVLDLFCGLGNFTLPIAQKVKHVTGVEGDEIMVKRAKQNALDHQIINTQYFVADLTKIDPSINWIKKKYDKVLLDPPRSGAFEIVELLKPMKASIIVYVSCQPSSLVRDAKVLIEAGYKLTHFGLMDMFPQTAHIESMAVFKK